MGHSSPDRTMAAAASTAELPVDHVLLAHRQRLCSQLDNFRKNNVMCDVTVVCDTTEFTAHKVILSAASAFFHNLLTEDSTRLPVPEVLPEVMELILSFVYTGHVLASVQGQQLQSVLAAAHQLRITHLYHWCRERLVAGLTLDNLEHVWDVADLYSDPWLQSQVAMYAAKHFRKLVRHSLFLQLPAERVVALLGNEKLQVGALYHDDVLGAVLIWVRHDEEHRRRVLPDIIPHIKFDKLSARYINSLDGEETVMASLELLQALTKTMARRYQQGNGLKSELQQASDAEMAKSAANDSSTFNGYTILGDGVSSSQLPFMSLPPVLAMEMNKKSQQQQRHSYLVPISGDTVNHNSTDGITLPNYRERRMLNDGLSDHNHPGWASFNTEIQTARIRGGKSSVDDDGSDPSPGEPVLLVLGQDKDDYVILQQFSLKTRRWGSPYRAPVQKKYSSIIAHHGVVLIIGGKINLKPTASVHACHVRSRHTEPLRDMRLPRCGMGLAALDGLVYAVGGYNKDGWLRQVECYDAKSDTWQRVAPLHEGKEGVGVVTANGRLYAVGGVPVPSTEMYDPLTDQWTRLTRMRHARVYHGISVLDGLVYVVGGFGHQPDRVQCLDCDTATWDVLSSRSPQQCRDTWCAAVAIGKRLLVVNSEGLLWDFDVTSECWTKLPSSVCLVGGYISGFVSATVIEDDDR